MPFANAYKQFRHIMGNACKAEDLLPVVLFIGISTVVVCFIRTLIEIVAYTLSLEDETASSLERASHIFVLSSCAVSGVFISGLCLYLYKKNKCQVEHRVGIFIQITLINWILVYCEGRGGWSAEYGLFILPPLGVVMDIPLAINLGTIVVGGVIQALILFALRYDPTVVWFSQPSIPELQIILYLTAAILPLFMTHVYATSLKEEQVRMKEMEKKVVEILGLLKHMKTDEVKTILENELNVRGKDELLETISELEAKLSTYRPFIPYALINPRSHEDEEEHDEGDGGESSEDEDDVQNDQTTGVAQRDKSVKDDRVGFDGEANVLKTRKSTVVHVFLGQLPSPWDTRANKTKCDVASFVCKVLEYAEKHKGDPMQVTPNSIVLSWNTHTYCMFHARDACKFALDIGALLPTSTILVSTGMNYFGTVGNQSMRSPFVGGEFMDLAKRTTSLARYTLGCGILITDETHKSCGADITARPVDVVCPQWFEGELHVDKVVLYELIGGKSQDAPQLDTYRQGFNYLKQGEVRKALGHFTAYCERRPGDNQVHRLLKICQVWEGATPYSRKELCWEVVEPDGVEPVVPLSKTVLPKQGDDISPTVMPEDSLNKDLAAVQSHFRAKEKELTEVVDTGFFSMFVAEEDEDDAPAATADEVKDEMSTAVPRSFKDGNGATWVRGEPTIGTGAFSNVYLALSDRGEPVAIKCFSMAAKKSTLDELSAEVVTLSELRHENIVGYVSCAGTPNHFIILMEYVSGGSLMKMVEEFKPLPLGAIRNYLHSILRGLAYLHSHGITHCDMKPHNVLLGPDGVCKLSDFGSAMKSMQSEEEKVEAAKLKAEEADKNIVDSDPTVKGTSWYMSPEAARGQIEHSNDIWSLGITLLEMVTGSEPWQWKGKEEEFIAKLGKDPEMMPPIDPTIPSEIKDFIGQCFIRDPTQRPTAEKLLNHQFVAD